MLDDTLEVDLLIQREYALVAAVATEISVVTTVYTEEQATTTITRQVEVG